MIDESVAEVETRYKRRIIWFENLRDPKRTQFIARYCFDEISDAKIVC